MELNNCKKKLKVLFDKFFKEKLELSSYDRENLVKRLADSGKRTENIFETPFFSDLLIYALNNIDKATISVKILITQLVNMLIENELQFCKFVQLEGFTMVAKKVLNVETVTSVPSLTTASFKICSSIISHSTGVYWAMQYGIWKTILRQVRDKPKHFAAEAYNFIAKLVWKLDEYDEEAALTDVLKFIVEPIKNNEYPNRVLDAEGEEVIYSPLLPYLEALKAILDETNRIIRPNKVIPLLCNYLLIEPVLSILLSVTRDRNFAYFLSQIVFRISFACTVSVAMHNKEEHDLAREITVVYYNVFNELIRKQMPQECVHFTASCFVFWSKFDKSVVPASFERHGRTYLVENQFLTILIVPLLTYSCIKNKRQEEESLEAFHYKLSTLTEEHIIKAAYSIFAILESDLDTRKGLAIDALRRLFEIKSYLSGRQAGVLYQALFYNLQYYTVTDESGALTVGENPITCPDDVKMLSLLLEAIRMLLKEHKINWYESVEIICLQNSLMNLLKQNILPSKQLLQALDLINLSIQQFLSPDMALLIASRRGSTLDELAAVMSTYLRHPEWEVRDSALHLLLSCTELAYVKYVPMQALLSESDVIPLAGRAAVSEEPYVQTTALRCLAAATNIEGLWAIATSGEPDLHMQLMYILKNDPESGVRKEAANVLLKLYTNQKTSPDFVRCLYNVMTSAAVDDLDWEVQIVALHFWKIAIQYQLSNRGMIDGKFPTVTFCKERRKIVTLNEREIQKQLNGIMNDLAAIGCLNVLNKCLVEEYNIQVIEKAYNVAKELVSILDCYKFQDVLSIVKTPPYEEDDNRKEDHTMDIAIDATQKTEILRNQVIDSIVSTSQCDLICDLYEAYVEIKTNGVDKEYFNTNENKWIDPNEFLKNFRERDYLAMIEEKRNWHSGPKSLDALLDEILELKLR